MPKLRVTLEDFDKALRSLNDKLVQKNDRIEIRSIGGYAMLRHGLRIEEDGSGFTEDIDSLTDTFNDDIQVLINEVAEEQDLLTDWLNNDPIHLPEAYGVKDTIEWVEDETYSNIDLYYATLSSLLLLKVRAVDGGGLVPRKTDKNDMIKILKKMGINNLNELIEDERTEFIAQYNLCFGYLEKRRSW